MNPRTPRRVRPYRSCWYLFGLGLRERASGREMNPRTAAAPRALAGPRAPPRARSLGGSLPRVGRATRRWRLRTWISNWRRRGLRLRHVRPLT